MSIVRRFNTLMWILVVLVPLGIWKLIEIIAAIFRVL